MATFLVFLLLAAPCVAAGTPAVTKSSESTAATPAPGSLDSSKIRLDAHDLPGALADAEAVVAKTGSAEAYAARADARRAEGLPMEGVLSDLAQAARLDPRYIEKYQGLIAQNESEKNPKRDAGDSGMGGVPVFFLGLAAVLGIGCVVVGTLIARSRRGKPAAPDDESIKPGGKEVKPDAHAAPDDPEKPQTGAAKPP